MPENERRCSVCGEFVKPEDLVSRDGQIMCITCAEKKDDE